MTLMVSPGAFVFQRKNYETAVAFETTAVMEEPLLQPTFRTTA
jgi:hypothetical protein